MWMAPAAGEFPHLQITRAEPEHASIVRHLVREAYAKWVPVIGREPMPMKADYERAIREHEIELLHDNGQLAALIEIIMHPDHLFIENIAVAPEFQGRGLGRHLLRHAEWKAGQAGLSEIRLLTNLAFDSNIRLYQSAGFHIDRTEPFMAGATVYMSKAQGPSRPRTPDSCDISVTVRSTSI
jgi:ribosomal protein S18 acetylase RimI-like enzyme